MFVIPCRTSLKMTPKHKMNTNGTFILGVTNEDFPLLNASRCVLDRIPLKTDAANEFHHFTSTRNE